MRDKGAALIANLKRRFITVNDDVLVGNTDINILRPRSAEELISEADFEHDERLPYWAELWPSSTVLANALTQLELPAQRAIELGCGTGLVSIAATLAGHDVLATDYYEDALQFTRANAYWNLGRDIDTRLVDWRNIPDDIGKFTLLFASDVLYESSYATVVSRAIDKLLAPKGRAYIADPGRVAVATFLGACDATGLRVVSQTDRPYRAGAIQQTISVYALARR